MNNLISKLGAFSAGTAEFNGLRRLRWLVTMVWLVMPCLPTQGGVMVLWNKLGGESEITNSAYGPDLQFYTGGSWPDSSANPAYVPGVFGGALTIGEGNYTVYSRVHHAVLTNVQNVINPNHGTVEVWLYQVTDPVVDDHGIYRIFDGAFGFGCGMYFHCYAGQGLELGLVFGGSETKVTYNMSHLNGQWAHLAAVWDRAGIDGTSDKLRLYVNGQKVAATASATWGSAVGARADIAGGNDGNIAGQFYLDNLKIFNYARTDFSNRLQEDDGVPELGLLSVRASQVELCWDTFTNKIYQLEYKSSLTTNEWLPLGAPFQGNGSRFCTNDPVAAGTPQRFYRVVLTNSP